MKKFRLVLFLLLLTSVLVYPSPVLAQAIDPQYLIFIKAPTGGGPNPWIQQQPETITSKVVDEIRGYIGTSHASNRYLGIGFILFYLNFKAEDTQTVIRKMINVANTEKIPMYFSFTSAPTWENRPDLWNWWDPTMHCKLGDTSKICYDPANKNNVEWTSWNASSATKISWFDWGENTKARRSPPPNLGSPVLAAEETRRLNEFIPIIANWYKSLPDSEKYLFAGIQLDAGSVGIDSFHYLDGNSYLENYPNSSSHDPTFSLGPDKPPMAQLGYAMVKSLGIKTLGTITQSDINQGIQKAITIHTKEVYDMGIPADKIFVNTYVSHQNYNQTLTSFSFTNAMTPYSRPMAEFLQGDNFANPVQESDFISSLKSLGNTPVWGMQGDVGYLSPEALNNSMNYPGNKAFLVIPWEGLYAYDASGHVTGMNNASIFTQVLNTNPPCLVAAPSLHSSVSENQVTLSWEAGANTAGMYLLISDKPDRELNGQLFAPNIQNGPVSLTGNKTITLGMGTYYAQAIVDGCLSTGVQRRTTDNQFQISPLSSPTSVPKIGDIDGDGDVDSADFDKMVANFGHPYTIFDYNILVGNFGK